MRSVLEYSALCVVISALGLLVLLSSVPPDSARGVVTAVSVALPLQIIFFALLVRYRDHPTGFLGAWVGGMLGRLALVGLMAFAVTWRDDLSPAATLLTLAGLLFGLLLLEPLFLRKRLRDSGTG